MSAATNTDECNLSWGYDASGCVSEDIEPLAVPTLLGACRLLDFWNTRPEDGLLIGRDVPSRKIGPLLSNIMVCEPVDEGRDLLVHLSGDGVRHRFGAAAKGKKLSQLLPREDFLCHLAYALHVVETNQPAVFSSHLHSRAVDLIRMEVVALPVWSQERSAKWVLAGLFYFR